jgi:mRNA interferase RelE/StbE
MKYDIVLAPEAVEDWKNLKANMRTEVKEAIEQHLRHSPTKVSKSRIKRLRGLTHPKFRLRIRDIRVFYDVAERTVEVLAIIEKSESDKWLERHGE